MSKKLALVIGNNIYSDPEFPSLSAPVNDVVDLARVLRDPDIGGFDEVTELIDENTSNILRTVARFFAKKSHNDILLLYFSGHGALDDHGHFYLVAKDTEHDLLSGTAVSANFITQEMDRSRSRQQVLILDSCNSAAFFQGAKGTAGGRAVIANAFEGNRHSRIVLAASNATQFAWEGEQFADIGQHSLFTHYLIEGLRTGEADLNADGKVSLNELYDYIHERVHLKTPKQTPRKWIFRETEDILIANNPNFIAVVPHSNSSDLEEHKTMKEHNTSKSSGKIRIILLGLIFGALGIFIFQKNFKNSDVTPASISAARSEMLTLKIEAERARAQVLAEETYKLALEEAVTAEEESVAGNFSAARISFGAAADYFRRAIEEVKSQNESAIKQEEEQRQKDRASLARRDMLTLKAEAEKAGSDTYARGDYRGALDLMKNGDREYDDGNYEKALSQYQSATEQFRVARNMANTETLERQSDLEAIRTSVRALQQEMLKEKEAAERVEAKTLAAGQFEQGEENETAGSNNFQQGTKSGLVAAQEFYAAARDDYLKATELAIETAREADEFGAKARKEKEVEAERVRAARDQQRQTAEAARSAMQDTKQQVPGTFSERSANAAYDIAGQLETQADEQFQSGNFQGASTNFLEAEKLYAQATRELTPLLEKRRAEEAEKRKIEEARTDILNIIEVYKNSLETEDASKLASTFYEDKWKNLFKPAENITVEIYDQNIVVGNKTADASFRFYISYKIDGEIVRKPPVQKNWQLEQINGNWKLKAPR